MKQVEYALSVIVPVYGVEKYMAQCARSLFSQDMQGLEFIFVDDCSPDNSIPILETIINCEYPSLKENIQIIRLPQNKGVSNARNVGISKATGEYVTFCDSDDWIEADMYSVLFSLAKDKNADIVTCDFIKEFKDNSIIIHQPFSYDMVMNIRKLLNGYIFPSLWSSIVKKEIYIKNKIQFPNGLNIGEDLAVNIFLFTSVDSFVHCSYPLYHYCQREGSLCSIKTKQTVDTEIAIAQLIDSYLKTKGDFKLFKKEIAYRKFVSKLPLIEDLTLKDYTKWIKIFPESHKYICFFKHLKIRKKIEYWLLIHKCFLCANLIVRLAHLKHFYLK